MKPLEHYLEIAKTKAREEGHRKKFIDNLLKVVKTIYEYGPMTYEELSMITGIKNVYFYSYYLIRYGILEKYRPVLPRTTHRARKTKRKIRNVLKELSGRVILYLKDDKESLAQYIYRRIRRAYICDKHDQKIVSHFLRKLDPSLKHKIIMKLKSEGDRSMSYAVRLKKKVEEKLVRLLINGRCEEFFKLIKTIEQYYRRIDRFFNVEDIFKTTLRFDSFGIDDGIEKASHVARCLDGSTEIRVYIDLKLDYDEEMRLDRIVKEYFMDESDIHMVIETSSYRHFLSILKKIDGSDKIPWTMKVNKVVSDTEFLGGVNPVDEEIVLAREKPRYTISSIRVTFDARKVMDRIRVYVFSILHEETCSNNDECLDTIRDIYSKCVEKGLNPYIVVELIP